MRISQLTTAALALVILSGCVATKDEYESYQTVLQGSKSVQREVLKECTNKRTSPQSLKVIAMVLDTSEDKAKPLFCKRLVVATTNGRLNYDDYVNGVHGKITPKIIKVIQGR